MKKIVFIPIVVAILAAFFASPAPDGLDQVARTLGFSDKAVVHAAPMAEYAIPFLDDSKVSAMIAGVIGLGIIFALFWLCIFYLRKSREKAEFASATQDNLNQS